MNVEKFELENYLKEADLSEHKRHSEAWSITDSSFKLAYFTHGFFRFFGKFPPPVASRFLDEYTVNKDEIVLDPMVGSGTTLVEATIKNFDAVGVDVNALCALISKVKSTYVSPKKIQNTLDQLDTYLKNNKEKYLEYIPNDKYLSHWFFKKNINSMAKIRQFLENKISNKDVKDLYVVGLASLIRNISRASKAWEECF